MVAYSGSVVLLCSRWPIILLTGVPVYHHGRCGGAEELLEQSGALQMFQGVCCGVQIQALNGAIASHGSQQDYDSHDPAALQGGVVQPPATATYHLQVGLYSNREHGFHNRSCILWYMQ